MNFSFLKILEHPITVPLRWDNNDDDYHLDGWHGIIQNALATNLLKLYTKNKKMFCVTNYFSEVNVIKL